MFSIWAYQMPIYCSSICHETSGYRTSFCRFHCFFLHLRIIGIIFSYFRHPMSTLIVPFGTFPYLACSDFSTFWRARNYISGWSAKKDFSANYTFFCISYHYNLLLTVENGAFTLCSNYLKFSSTNALTFFIVTAIPRFSIITPIFMISLFSYSFQLL